MFQKPKIIVFSVLNGQGLAIVSEEASEAKEFADQMARKFLTRGLDCDTPLDNLEGFPEKLRRMIKKLVCLDWQKDSFLALVQEKNGAILAYGLDPTAHNSQPAQYCCPTCSSVRETRPGSGLAKQMRLNELRSAL